MGHFGAHKWSQEEDTAVLAAYENTRSGPAAFLAFKELLPASARSRGSVNGRYYRLRELGALGPVKAKTPALAQPSKKRSKPPKVVGAPRTPAYYASLAKAVRYALERLAAGGQHRPRELFAKKTTKTGEVLNYLLQIGAVHRIGRGYQDNSTKYTINSGSKGFGRVSTLRADDRALWAQFCAGKYVAPATAVAKSAVTAAPFEVQLAPPRVVSAALWDVADLVGYYKTAVALGDMDAATALERLAARVRR